MSSNEATQLAKKEKIVVSRIIDAPVERVWKAWIDPKEVMRWWGPEDYTSPSCKIDLREGGRYVFSMRPPRDQGGSEQYTAGVYKRIVPLNRLEFTQNLADKDGNSIDPTSVGLPAGFPRELRAVVRFRKVGCDMTQMTVTQHGWTPGQMFVYAIAGLNQSMDKLARSASRSCPATED